MLALSMEDIDLENCQIHITKTYYRMNRTDMITEPKTDNSVRTIEIPVFLANEIQSYWKRLYQYPKNERLFPVVAEAVLNTYGHLYPSEQKKVASLLDHLIADNSEEKENAPAGNKGISE